MDMVIRENIRYVGVNDYELDLFEGQYAAPNGMAYNSYVILDEKIAVFDTVDKAFKKQWLDNLERELKGKTPDYLIVQHMEPDHSANILAFVNRYPNAKIVSSNKSFVMMKNYFGTDFADKQLVVSENDTLELGKHVLRFFVAPMVHWPEVIVTYEETEKILFSADAFGKFGATDTDEDWACEARRYYFGIVGKYGVQVQAALKKAAGLEIQILCPLHGIIWRTNPGYFIDKYNIWSTYQPEENGVMIAYASMYGNTENMAEIMAFKLAERGVKVKLYDVSSTDTSWLLSEAFHYSHILLASPTYNGGIYPLMDHFIHEMKSHGLKNRTFAFIDNGTWGPVAAKQMAKQIEELKDCTILNETISIKSALKEDQMAVLDRIADALKA